jgi:hypothetical protein
MELGEIIRDAVAIAHTETESIQATVLHHAWIAEDSHGTDTFAPPVSLTALVVQRQEPRMSASGVAISTRAKLTFLQPVPANGAPGRIEPIDTRDRFTLPDGSSDQVVDVSGLIDKDTGRPFTTVVYLGEVTRGAQ